MKYLSLTSLGLIAVLAMPFADLFPTEYFTWLPGALPVILMLTTLVLGGVLLNAILIGAAGGMSTEVRWNRSGDAYRDE